MPKVVFSLIAIAIILLVLYLRGPEWYRKGWNRKAKTYEKSDVANYLLVVEPKIGIWTEEVLELLKPLKDQGIVLEYWRVGDSDIIDVEVVGINNYRRMEKAVSTKARIYELPKVQPH